MFIQWLKTFQCYYFILPIDLYVIVQELDRLDKKILSILYSARLLSIDPKEALKDSIYDEGLLETRLDHLYKQNLITRDLRITDKGKDCLQIVFAGGVFDIIHPGHIHTLRSAKSLGDILVVVIARDSTAIKSKGKKPMHNEHLRCELVGSLKFVDAAILGREGDIFKSVEYVRPNIIALGYDQVHEESLIAEECKKRGLNIQVIRLDSPIPDLKSTRIKELLGKSIYNF
ncbi:MAG: FAD synthase [Candidatus Nitrosothermus koennekii]|nr:MAG: FAD synthase [Candidatus Nitrosothermus koennekii]